MPIESETTNITAIPDVSLPDLDGQLVSLREYAIDRPLVVVFACNHCPYVQSIESVLGDVARDQTDVAWLAICSNDISAYPDDDIPGLRQQIQRARWPFPYLVDTSQDVARTFGAVCTPDFFVFDSAGALIYRGAMDDARPKQPQPVDAAHLLAALAAARRGEPFLGGKPALGCGLKWKSD